MIMTSDFLNLMIFGVQPPVPGYFSRIAEEMAQEDLVIGKLRRMKAMIFLIETLETCEAA